MSVPVGERSLEVMYRVNYKMKEPMLQSRLVNYSQDNVGIKVLNTRVMFEEENVLIVDVSEFNAKNIDMDTGYRQYRRLNSF
ncbi:hypothetical protein QTP88_009318 [Uroleucon formosanum]